MLTTLAEKVDPRHAALLVIDMQNDFCHDDGAKAHDGGDVSLVQAIVPPLQALIDGAHEASVPVVFTQAVHNQWTDTDVRLERHRTQEANCIEGTWGVEFFGVAPEERDMVLPKARFSAFLGTELDRALRARGVRTLVLTGTATSACVESTARDGFMRDYYIVVAPDCCAQGDLARHEAALKAIDGPFGVLAPSGEVLGAWAELGKPAF
ncbi:MAG: cysteine hydrolase [Chloroflexi bacterium]|nr:cysteine hydrolase [Chloroflexota bacterium]